MFHKKSSQVFYTIGNCAKPTSPFHHILKTRKAWIDEQLPAGVARFLPFVIISDPIIHPFTVIVNTFL